MMADVKIVAIILALALAWYLFGSFVAATLNIAEWSQDGRFMIAVLWVVSSIVAGVCFSKEGGW